MNIFTKWVFAILMITVSLLLLSCSPSKIEEDNHIHTLVFDPTDAGTFYLATHFYLEKHTANSIEIVGPNGEDYMGLVISKDGEFYSSGHSPKIANVGIRKSVDKGNTWQILEYEGLDFHDMTVSYANPSLIYAWSTPPSELLVISKDSGKSWEEIGTEFQQSLFALAADHQQENRLYAGALSGLFISENYGGTWERKDELKNITILAIADDLLQAGKIYLSTYQKGVLVTEDEGETWKELNLGLDFSEDPLLTLAVDPFLGKIYGVTKHNLIYRYDGVSWEIVP